MATDSLRPRDAGPRLILPSSGWSASRPGSWGPLAIAVAAAVGRDVKDEGKGDDDPPDEVESADAPEQDVGDRGPGEEDEAERGQEEALEHQVPAGRIDQPPEEDQSSRA